MDLRLASPEDAEEILNLQKRAFYGQAKIYGLFDIPPLLQTLPELLGDFKEYEIYMLLDESGKIIGSIRAKTHGSSCYLGRLIVDPTLQNQGLASDIMRTVESRYPAVEKFELFTGHKSARNLHLYTQKLGYSIVGEEKVNEKLTNVLLEKKRE